jgi:ABC-type dipeptide/oligopeptide/nickel transport system permease subunit
MSTVLAAPSQSAVGPLGWSAAPGRRRVAAFGRRYARNRAALLGLALVVGLIGAALLAGVVSPFDPEAQFAAEALQPPSARHLLGTDQIGRDQLARIIFGARASISVGVLSMLFAGCIGIGLGLLAGYYRGQLDSLIMRLMDGLLAFPALLLAIFIVAVLGSSILNAILAVAIVNVPSFARLTRAQVLSVREKEFVESSRALGASDWRIMLVTILPNCLSPLIVQFTLGIGLGILVEAGLSFLGLGVRPPTPAWGSMLSTGRQFISLAPWLTTFPGLAIFLAVLGFNLVGDGLREALDPRLREGRGS